MPPHSPTIPRIRPTRRTVASVAAWTAPVIVMSTGAPAYAASPCDPRSNQPFRWSAASVTRTPTNNGLIATIDPDGAGPVPSLTVTVSATFSGNMVAGPEPGTQGADTAVNENYDVATGVGGLGTATSALTIQQATTSSTPQGYAERAVYTFTFSRPVTNLRFTVTDLDSNDNDFWDAVQLVAPAPTSVTRTDPTYLQARTADSRGNPVSPGYFRTTTDDAAIGNSSSRGNLQVSYAGTLSSFQLVYFNDATSFSSEIDTSQVIFVTDFLFDYQPC